LAFDVKKQLSREKAHETHEILAKLVDTGYDSTSNE